MDGLFHGKPYFSMDDLGVFPLFLETPMCFPMFQDSFCALWSLLFLRSC